MSPSTEVRENRELAAELKFLVNPALAEQIREWSRICLAPDPHGNGDLGDTYQISSFYFDTDQFDVFHRNGSYGRSKFRVRRYGGDEVAFVERKLKTRGLVSKRRTPVPLEQLARLMSGQPGRDWGGYWYHRRLIARKLHLVCQITYLRTARVAMTASGPVRLTLDDGIRAGVPGELRFGRCSDTIPLLEQERVLELKFRGEPPVLFKRLIEEFQLRAVPNSKYRQAVLALGLVRETTPSLTSASESSVANERAVVL